MDITCQRAFSLPVCTHTYQTMTVHSSFTHQTSHTDVQAYLAHQNTHLKSWYNTYSIIVIKAQPATLNRYAIFL